MLDVKLAELGFVLGFPISLGYAKLGIWISYFEFGLYVSLLRITIIFLNLCFDIII